MTAKQGHPRGMERLPEIQSLLKRAGELAEYALHSSEGEDIWRGDGSTESTHMLQELVDAIAAAEAKAAPSRRD